MRIIVLFLWLTFLCGFNAFGQYVPGGINYQAVARDISGNELKNRNVDIRISVISDNPKGDIEYSETHSATTDGFGLFSIIIGQGTPFAGKKSSLGEVSWGTSAHYLMVEVDFGDSNGFLSMGTMQLLAVPYALHAATAANAMVTKDYQTLSYDPELKELNLKNGGAVNLSNLYQILSYNNGKLSLTPGNEVTIDIRDDDSDPANELQNLSYSNYELSISKGNSVVMDNLLQDLQISQNHKLKITKNTQASEVDLRPYLDNTDNQILQIINDSLSISGGNRIKIDLSDTNEIQDLQINHDHILKITGNPVATSVDLSRYLDNTDNQILQITNDSLAISGGNKVKVDLSDTNEIQDIKLENHILKITDNPDASLIDLSVYMDNTDNQTLLINGYDLTVEKGNTVNIRPKIVAFRALRNGGNTISPGDSTEIKFTDTTLNISNAFDPGTGRFTVPGGGEGLYRFDLIYYFETTGHSLRFTLNGQTKEIIFNWPPEVSKSGLLSYHTLLYLNEGDRVSIYLKNTRATSINCQPSIFSGYRIH